MSWNIDGFSEHGLGTANPAPWLEFFLNLGAWTCTWEGEGSPQPLWPAAALRPEYEWLLSRSDGPTGKIRLFQFPESAPVTRAGAKTWDSGGFFDIDLRVADLPHWHETLLARQWGGISAPVQWQFGELDILEWLARGPEDVVVALIQRLAPPLVPAPPREGTSHAFNASQIVQDMDKALAFYDALGFELLVRHTAPLEGGGGEVLGLTVEQAASTPVDLAIVSPTGLMDGSVELVALPTLGGADLREQCGPGQRGLNIMRFPTQNLESLALDLKSQGITPDAMARWPCPGIGTVRGLALRSPDGAWLEFIEPE